MWVGVPGLGTGALLRVPHMARQKTDTSHAPAQFGNKKSRCLNQGGRGLLRLDFRDANPVPLFFAGAGVWYTDSRMAAMCCV